MRILVPAIGSRGDVQPYVNLCQGLQAAGYEVTLATNPTLCSLAEAHGVKNAPIGPPVDMGAEGARLMAHSFNNMWLGMIRVMQLGGRLVEASYADVLELCKTADLVITTDTGSGISEAEKLGVPWISVTLQPGRIPMQKPNPSAVSRAVWSVLGRLFVAPTNRFRRKVGAPPVKDIADMLSKRLILLPVSCHVAPPDPLWPPQVQPTGYWFARPDESWRPPRALVEFLEAGERPVAVSLGVMSQAGKQAREGAQMVLEAVRLAGVRAVIQGWEAVLKEMDVPETVFHAGTLPHAWLFDRAAAVVHHGGFGTTAAVLRSGALGIVIPHVIDQFYWGQRVYELGTGPRFISRGQLTVEKLQAAIRQALEGAQMRATAAAVGQAIRAEPDGVTRAVKIIEQGLAGGGWASSPG